VTCDVLFVMGSFASKQWPTQFRSKLKFSPVDQQGSFDLLLSACVLFYMLHNCYITNLLFAAMQAAATLPLGRSGCTSTT
jgi:hypothetical protein